VLFLDNLSCLLRSEHGENSAESWDDMQQWLLSLRRKGKSVFLIHHSGKGGDQRGTSRREDILDNSIKLKRSGAAMDVNGLCAELSFEKCRTAFGADVEPIEVTLDGAGWTWKPLPQANFDRIVALTNDGAKPKEIAELLGVDKSTVSRSLKKGRQLELVKKKGSELWPD